VLNDILMNVTLLNVSPVFLINVITMAVTLLSVILLNGIDAKSHSATYQYDEYYSTECHSLDFCSVE